MKQKALSLPSLNHAQSKGRVHRIFTPAGTYYIVLKSYDASGTLSSYSNEVTVTVTSSITATELLGAWSGDWTNTTYSSTGGCTLTIAQGTTGTLNLTLDLDGLVGGYINPDPQTLEVTINSNGNFTYSGTLNLLGPLSFTITPEGNISITANQIDVTGFSSFTATGTVTSAKVNINYTVTFTGGSTATGTVTGAK